MIIKFDPRWSGDHGIGRVSRILDAQLCLPHLAISGKPSSPLDPLRLFFAMLKLPNNCAVFSPGYNAPLFVVRPYVFTILDLNHIDRPENSSFFKRLYYRFIMRRAAHKAFRVLTISEFSRQRIIDWSGIDPCRVVNISCGVDSCYTPNVAPFASDFPYLLCVSNRKAHKNEPRVVEAFAKANIDSDIRLYFTGNVNEQMMSLCQQLGIQDRVVFMGRIPENDLPGLYRGALALVFPSLYEGFGLPVIESMACGTPVITSNTTSLAEVAGDAALLVDPLSIEQISTRIEWICTDMNLRETLIERGLIQAKKFNWDMVAYKVKIVLDDLGKEEIFS